MPETMNTAKSVSATKNSVWCARVPFAYVASAMPIATKRAAVTQPTIRKLLNARIGDPFGMRLTPPWGGERIS